MDSYGRTLKSIGPADGVPIFGLGWKPHRNISRNADFHSPMSLRQRPLAFYHQMPLVVNDRGQRKKRPLPCCVCGCPPFRSALGKIDLLATSLASMFSVEFVWKNFLFFVTVGAFADEGPQVLKLFISWAVLRCGHNYLLGFRKHLLSGQFLSNLFPIILGHLDSSPQRGGF